MEQFMKFDRAKAERFRDAYTKALMENETSFSFEGGDFLVTYAKYVLEYLTDQGIL
jgi:hypothetical protein